MKRNYSCLVSCKEALATTETFICFMENQDYFGYVDLLQIYGYIRKVKNKNRPTEKSKKDYRLIKCV
jgi:hypothetical protein